MCNNRYTLDAKIHDAQRLKVCICQHMKGFTYEKY